MKAVRIWLWTGVVMVLIQVMIGGITRLTESGLSITEWDVVMGSMPPGNDAEWEKEFQLYQSSAQYAKINSDFSVEQFKKIYWWEFIHRNWARLISIVFLFPFIYFLLKKKFNAAWIRKLAVVFLLGGLQGFVGWIMVASGLEGDPWVDPSKLTIHLLLALIVFMYLIWLALSYRETPVISDHPSANSSIKWIIILILIQISLGGLMAGTDAGRLYNTYPLMNGRVIPEGAFHDIFTADKLVALSTEINFLHRSFAIIVALAIIGFWFQNRKYTSTRLHKLNSAFILVLCLQFLLGVFTLLGSSENIPVFLGVSHQVVACLLLGLSVTILFYSKHRDGVVIVKKI
ncbi:MAG: COX15/CtaA family protein [Bacteroidetes bacterium]|nr:COX15/CtaA family protein [Bacteroidota bacterium]